MTKKTKQLPEKIIISETSRRIAKNHDIFYSIVGLADTINQIIDYLKEREKLK